MTSAYKVVAGIGVVAAVALFVVGGMLITVTASREQRRRADRIDEYIRGIELWESELSVFGDDLEGTRVGTVGETSLGTQILELDVSRLEAGRSHDRVPVYTPSYQTVSLGDLDLAPVAFAESARPANTLFFDFVLVTPQQPTLNQTVRGFPIQHASRSCSNDDDDRNNNNRREGCDCDDGIESGSRCLLTYIARSFCVVVDNDGLLDSRAQPNYGCDSLVKDGTNPSSDLWDPAGDFDILPPGSTGTFSDATFVVRNANDPYVVMADVTGGDMQFGEGAVIARIGALVCFGLATLCLVCALVCGVCERRRSKSKTAHAPIAQPYQPPPRASQVPAGYSVAQPQAPPAQHGLYPSAQEEQPPSAPQPYPPTQQQHPGAQPYDPRLKL